jgi:hypothetical protein
MKIPSSQARQKEPFNRQQSLPAPAPLWWKISFSKVVVSSLSHYYFNNIIEAERLPRLLNL